MKITFVLKQGSISGLAKHLVKKYGGDPNFFAKCMACEELKSYDPERKKAICAQAHKEAVGYWPGDKKN